MLKKFIAPLSIAALLAVGCNKSVKTTAAACDNISESEAYEKFKASKNDGKAFGEQVTTSGAVAYDEILARLKKEKNLANVKVVGKVEAVCKAKGCWMNIASEKGAPSMFVKFKDYAFFMPKDLAGKKVVMLGNAYTEVTTVEELRHFAEDEGKTKEDIAKIRKPKTDVKFMATGVLILD